MAGRPGPGLISLPQSTIPARPASCAAAAGPVQAAAERPGGDVPAGHLHRQAPRLLMPAAGCVACCPAAHSPLLCALAYALLVSAALLLCSLLFALEPGGVTTDRSVGQDSRKEQCGSKRVTTVQGCVCGDACMHARMRRRAFAPGPSRATCQGCIHLHTHRFSEAQQGVGGGGPGGLRPMRPRAWLAASTGSCTQTPLACSPGSAVAGREGGWWVGVGGRQESRLA